MNGALQPTETRKTLQCAHDQIRCQIRDGATQVIQRRTRPQFIPCLDMITDAVKLHPIRRVFRPGSTYKRGGLVSSPGVAVGGPHVHQHGGTLQGRRPEAQGALEFADDKDRWMIGAEAIRPAPFPGPVTGRVHCHSTRRQCVGVLHPVAEACGGSTCGGHQRIAGIEFAARL